MPRRRQWQFLLFLVKFALAQCALDRAVFHRRTLKSNVPFSNLDSLIAIMGKYFSFGGIQKRKITPLLQYRDITQ